MLISAIMPTRGRPQFAPHAVECFLAQDWPEKELVIVDDSNQPSFRTPPLGVRYVQLPQMSIGAKRNIAVARATGDIIVHFDDDDYSAPGRIRDQVERLMAYGLGCTGYNELAYVDEAGKRWQYRGSKLYAVGCTLMYTRDFWRARPFADRNKGEDNEFIRNRRISTDTAGDLMLARIHRGNTSQKQTHMGGWHAA